MRKPVLVVFAAGLSHAAFCVSPVRRVDEADYLTAEQKRDIFYNNAARFLRLEGRK
jgi:predicted TIM-barrel fold metal-dependent hydrolase